MLFPCEVKFKGTGHGCSPCLGFMAGGSLVQPPYCPASSDVPHFTLLLFLNHYIHINDTFGAIEDTLFTCSVIILGAVRSAVCSVIIARTQQSLSWQATCRTMPSSSLPPLPNHPTPHAPPLRFGAPLFHAVLCHVMLS